ncbi:chemotaxis protein CheB [Pedobacter ginsengiterrae]|uniref:protein-glutamate methylesterase n=2 Tax=Pedobacter ginsengiterrae TaxID=871696 RepID=A0ABP7NY36_9SPHI
MSPDVRGILPEIFNKLNSIHAANAYDLEAIVPNRIYVAPPDHHLLVEEGLVRVTHGPKENRFRPAVDPLFRSAAYAYGNRVIGIILSGGLDDGTAGLWRIKSSGGVAVVQDPADAEVSSMPESAMREVDVDYCVPLDAIAELLVKLTTQDIKTDGTTMRDDKTRIEINIAAEENALENGSLDIGSLSPYACPECHGVLSRITDGKIVRFRCHTGHAYSSDTLMAALSEKIEDSLYGAIRGMDESILLLNHLGDHFAENNQLQLAAIYFRKAKEVQERSTAIRLAVRSHEHLSKNKLMEEIDQDSTV